MIPLLVGLELAQVETHDPLVLGEGGPGKGQKQEESQKGRFRTPISPRISGPYHSLQTGRHISE
jgi:hypothetical protein